MSSQTETVRRKTALDILKMKSDRKIVSLTAYHAHLSLIHI